MNSTCYDSTFYDKQATGSFRSAQVVAPIVMDLVNPRSVVDFGCGMGTWLRAFLDCGVTDALGLDGEYVDRSRLQIPQDLFCPADLTRLQPLSRGFDLAICLEVGEHLPAAVSSALVRALTEAAPAVLFSAAIPGQGGTGHVNEQWPWYWEKMFATHGYVRLDAIRPDIWRDSSVEWWYRQNLVLYVRAARMSSWPRLAAEAAQPDECRLELVSRGVLMQVEVLKPSLRTLLRALPGAAWSAVARRLWRRA